MESSRGSGFGKFRKMGAKSDDEDDKNTVDIAAKTIE
jgi:hypothetical protein